MYRELEDKKYYWIKLKTDFFNQDAIDFIMSQKNGCEYIVLYQMLCLKTANSNGQLTSKIGEMIIPYDVDRIVRDTKYFDVDTVTIAMELFKHLGLIYEQGDNILAIAGFEDMIGKEPDRTNAERQKRFRERQKQKRLETSESNVTNNVTNNVTKRNESNVEIEIRDRDKSIEKDIDIDIDKEKDIKEKEIPKGISKKKVFSNNNIENFENMLNCENKEDSIIYINNNFVLVDAIKDWLEYKQGKGKQHLVYQEIGMRKFLSSIVEKDKTYGTRGVVRAINESISQGWQGIVWDKAEIPKAEMSYEEKKEQEEEQFLNKFGLTKEKFI